MSTRTGTYVDVTLVSTPFLSPADIIRFALAKAEHAEHVTDPPRDALHEAQLDVASRRLQIDVRLGNDVAEDVDRLRRVERVAKCRTERRLCRMKTMGRTCGPKLRKRIRNWVIPVTHAR